MQPAFRAQVPRLAPFPDEGVVACMGRAATETTPEAASVAPAVPGSVVPDGLVGHVEADKLQGEPGPALWAMDGLHTVEQHRQNRERSDCHRTKNKPVQTLPFLFFGITVYFLILLLL
jgi:hypothetical protein